jgi:hypothetical protein
MVVHYVTRPAKFEYKAAIWKLHEQSLRIYSKWPDLCPSERFKVWLYNVYDDCRLSSYIWKIRLRLGDPDSVTRILQEGNIVGKNLAKRWIRLSVLASSASPGSRINLKIWSFREDGHLIDEYTSIFSNVENHVKSKPHLITLTHVLKKCLIALVKSYQIL